MPIPLRCECGHELTVADELAGKKGRCPECGAVIEVPGRRREGRGGAYARIPGGLRPRGYTWLRGAAGFLMGMALVSLLFFLGIGVYSGVTALLNPDPFHGPFGLFDSLAEEVRANNDLMGVVFILGGIVSGSLSFLFLAAVGQAVRLLVSLEGSLAEIAERLGPR